MSFLSYAFSFCFNDPAPTAISTYCHTLSLHVALPISPRLIASQALAVAIAAEWAAQGETIDPAAMPLTGLANAAIDLAAPDPAAFAEPIAAYAASDLLCYRDDRDTALPAEQAAAWKDRKSTRLNSRH